jgi:hypothetical protein
LNIRKLLRECAADMGGDIDSTMAYEMAGSLLEDPRVLTAAKKEWPGKDKAILQEIMASCI